MQTPLTLSLLCTAARDYAAEVSSEGISVLYGVTDGKAVGTHVESGFNNFIAERYEHVAGNAAKGIDFPALNVDLKVTSIKQPQSSSPFRAATQKVYGLGYHLLVMVYEKTDDHDERTAKLDIKAVLFINADYTADFQMTSGILAILAREGNVDDLDAFLEEKNIPLDVESRRALAERILDDPPKLGSLTISNALQWRLQYGRALLIARAGSHEGILDLIGE